MTLHEHDLNPSRDTFSAYTEAGWFRALRAGADEGVYGPSVDHNGTNDYTFTLWRSVRSQSGNRLLGAVAGDIAVAAIEHVLESPMSRVGCRRF